MQRRVNLVKKRGIGMKNDAYEKLARALDLLPGAFPRTKSGVELQILRRIFSPEEALLACNMSGTSEPVDAIAGRVNQSEEEVEEKLKAMVRRGIIWSSKKDGIRRYRLAPFVVGIWEEQWDAMDHELAHLCEQYFNEGGLEGIMRPSPAMTRVVPAHRAIKTESILPYEDVKAIILAAKRFGLRECICRKQQDLAGTRKCDFPLDVCLNFSMAERPPGPHDITQEEALKVLDRAEEIGLVHTVGNVIEGVYYVCNCCGCCCAVLRGITQFGIENSVAKANYYAVVDPELCIACGICADRCQVGACTVDDIAKIDLTKCIGCGICVTGCDSEAVRLERRPDAEIMRPPEDFKAWEEQRLRNRGLL